MYLGGTGGLATKVVAGVGLIGRVDGIYWYVGAIIGQLVVWFVVRFVAQCATIVIANGGFPC
jgi:hypothetical protein